MADSDKKPDRKHILDWISALGGLATSVAVACLTYFYSWQGDEDRKLQWRPILSLEVHTAAFADRDRDQLGLLVQNVGKGPARIDLVCQVGALDRIDIAGLRESSGTLRPGTVISAGETFPLNIYTPEPGKSWDQASTGKVLDAFEQAKRWQTTIYYSALYARAGCFRVRRTLDQGEWNESTTESPCDVHSCEGDEKPVK